MRTRMVLAASGLCVELRDILLKDKPAEMLAASPKATVPVLVCSDGNVLEESRDIMEWALENSDPKNWYPNDVALGREIKALIDENDGPFKSALDRYKYHVRFPENSKDDYRKEGEEFLLSLDKRLSQNAYLMGDKPTLADIAIFPFVRQFANSDREWFDSAPYSALQKWLDNWTSSELFHHIMKKRTLWKPGSQGPLFPKLLEN